MEQSSDVFRVHQVNSCEKQAYSETYCKSWPQAKLSLKSLARPFPMRSLSPSHVRRDEPCQTTPAPFESHPKVEGRPFEDKTKKKHVFGNEDRVDDGCDERKERWKDLCRAFERQNIIRNETGHRLWWKLGSKEELI